MRPIDDESAVTKFQDMVRKVAIEDKISKQKAFTKVADANPRLLKEAESEGL